MAGILDIRQREREAQAVVYDVLEVLNEATNTHAMIINDLMAGISRLNERLTRLERATAPRITTDGPQRSA